jgi:ABC-type glycerol-3-phosphate transport system permease component
MDILGKAQDLFTQNMVTISIGLLVAVILAGFLWFFMSSRSQKTSVLENRARVNEATTSQPTQEQMEEIEKASQQQQAPEPQGESQ